MTRKNKTSNPFFKVADDIQKPVIEVEEPKPMLNFEPEEPIDIRSTFLKQIQHEVSVEEEPGKNISVYLSAESLKLIKSYMSAHRIQNRSKLIETIILSVLKQ